MSDRRAVLDHSLLAGAQAQRLGRLQEARCHFEKALQSLLDPEHTELAARLLRWVAWAHASEGDAEAALECLEASEAVASSAGDQAGVAAALNTRAGTLFGLGRLDDAEVLFERVRVERVREIAVATSDRKLKAMAEQNLGSVASIRGDLDVALRRFQSSRASYEAIGELSYLGPLLNNIGKLQIELKDDREAERTLDSARMLCQSQGDQHHTVIVDVNRGWVMLRSGRTSDALRTAEDARQLADETGDDRWIAEILLVIGACHVRLGDVELAMGFLDRAAHLARERGDVKTLADAVLKQAGALRLAGRNRRTLLCLDEAKRLFQQLRARRDLAHVGERLETLEESFLQIVGEWGESIERKDAYTRGHSNRVADYACMLARATDLPASDLRWFRMGALLHDVGKVVVPLDILNSAGPLSDEQ